MRLVIERVLCARSEELGAPSTRNEKLVDLDPETREHSFSNAHGVARDDIVRLCSLHDALHAHFLALVRNVCQPSDVREHDLDSTEIGCGQPR